MWRCESAAIERSASAKPRPSRNSLKPCFVLTRTGTRVARPRELAVDVARGRGACAGSSAGSARGRRRGGGRRAGSTSAPSGIASSGTPARRARARSPRRPARARAASAGARPSPARRARGGARAGAPRSRRCRRPCARWRTRTFFIALHDSKDAGRPRVDGVARRRRVRAGLGRSLPAPLRSSAASARRRSASSSERLALEAKPRLEPREELVEGRVRGEHGQAAPAGLVDGLVGSAGAHVVDERRRRRRGARRSGRAGPDRWIAARPSSSSSPIRRSSSARCARSSSLPEVP